MLASQAVIGIPSQYPGGDPLLILVPPAEQFRRDYVFLTPDTYAFNFVEIVAPDRAQILLDGAQLDMSVCARSNIPDLASDSSGAAPHWVSYGCQLSFPMVKRGLPPNIMPGQRNTGAHSLVADMPVGIVVSGFDRFVGYAYVGGLNIDVLH